MPITTILFDFAGVLVEERTLATEKKYHFEKLSKAKQQAYINAIHASEVGKLPSSQLLKVIHQTLLPQFSTSEILEHYLHAKALPASKLLQKLRKNYKVIIFSNHQKTWPARIMKNANINAAGVPCVNSSRVGLRKAHIDFYKYLIHRFRINPKTTIFIDDRIKNLHPAKKLGMYTFHYQNNYRQLIQTLKKLGVKGL